MIPDEGHRGALWGRAVASLAGALPQPFWTSQPGAPDPAPALTGALTADLAVVGAGFSGLWTALLARERDPSADVVLIEADTTGWAASGRNGEYAWGGAIDTCSRFFAFYGTARRGRLAYTCGHTGLGVGASRFAANVMLDLLAGQRTERTELELVRSRPVPFPPEPARSAVVQLTRASLARAEPGRRAAEPLAAYAGPVRAGV